MSFELPALKYNTDSLEPYIDARTMEIHHGKHHAGYTNNLNNAIKGTGLEGSSIEDVLTGLDLSILIKILLVKANVLPDPAEAFIMSKLEFKKKC